MSDHTSFLNLFAFFKKRLQIKHFIFLRAELTVIAAKKILIKTYLTHFIIMKICGLNAVNLILVFKVALL